MLVNTHLVLLWCDPHVDLRPHVANRLSCSSRWSRTRLSSCSRDLDVTLDTLVEYISDGSFKHYNSCIFLSGREFVKGFIFAPKLHKEEDIPRRVGPSPLVKNALSTPSTPRQHPYIELRTPNSRSVRHRRSIVEDTRRTLAPTFSVEARTWLLGPSHVWSDLREAKSVHMYQTNQCYDNIDRIGSIQEFS